LQKGWQDVHCQKRHFKRYKFMPGILITGATGFIGHRLYSCLAAEGHEVRCAVRQGASVENSVVIGNIGPDTRWGIALKGVEIVIHLAARVHVMCDTALDPLAEFRRVNGAGTLNLARQAAAAGVRRFIFLSTIKVNGEETSHDPGAEGTTCCFSEQDPPHPQDDYAISKHEAEQGLRCVAEETGMEVVIIRPPLVYGTGVKGNFSRMMHWINKGVPLPFGAIHNLRSMVGLDNLVDFIITCIDHPAAADQTFLISDDDDISTTELLRRVAQAMDKPVRLIPVPMPVLTFAAGLLGKQAVAQRLCGNLRVNISRAREVLGWTPPVSVDEGLRRAVRGKMGRF